MRKRGKETEKGGGRAGLRNQWVRRERMTLALHDWKENWVKKMFIPRNSTRKEKQQRLGEKGRCRGSGGAHTAKDCE